MRSMIRQWGVVLGVLSLMMVLTVAPALAETSVTVALKGEPNTLDPHRVIGRQSEAFLANIYDGLTSRDREGRLQPGLAESWEHTNALTWRFRLRRNVKFHNGEPFSSESVKFTLDRALNPDKKATTWSQIRTISEVRIVDDYTVDIITSQPDILLPARLSELFGPMLPPKHTREKGEDIGTNPVGTGPFKFVKWIKNEQLVLEANKDYWRGAPKVDRLVIRPIAEDAARVSALLAGEVDLIEGLPYVMADVVDRFPKTHVEKVTAARVFYIAINPNVQPLDDIRVRQALNYAINRQAIIDKLYLGNGRPAATVVASQAFGFDPSVEPYPYDPKKARQLLADAGYPNGFAVEFDYFTGSIADHYTPSQAIAGYLSDIGIKVKSNVYEIGVFQEKRSANNAAPLYVYSLGDVFLEPVWLVEWLMAGDMSRRYNNPKVAELVKEITKTFNPEARRDLYSKVQKLMKEDAQHIFLFQVDTVWGVSDRIDFKLRADEVPWFYPIKLAK